MTACQIRRLAAAFFLFVSSHVGYEYEFDSDVPLVPPKAPATTRAARKRSHSYWANAQLQQVPTREPRHGEPQRPVPVLFFSCSSH